MLDLSGQIKTAMKARDSIALNGWRSVKAKANYKFTEKGRGDKPLDEGEILALVRREVREREEANEHLAKTAPEYADNVSIINMLQAHLPAELSGDALEKTLNNAIAQSGATSPQDMGKVMQILRKLEGINMGVASKRVKELLQVG